MFGIDAAQKLRQNRSLSRRVHERHFKKSGERELHHHSPRVLADEAYLKELAKDTRQRHRKEDVSAMLIALSLLGLMIALFFWLMQAS